MILHVLPPGAFDHSPILQYLPIRAHTLSAGAETSIVIGMVM
jgi:hypothetical protein